MRRPFAFGGVAGFCMVMSLALNGCSTEYAGERFFWKAEQARAAVLADPSRATAEQYAKAMSAFQRVTKRVRGTKWAARAHAAMGALYALQGQDALAREQYASITRNYSQYTPLATTAYAALAKIYEREQDWDRAIETYAALADRYPWTSLGIEAPLYIGRLTEAHGSPQEAAAAYQRAADLYTAKRLSAPTPAEEAQVTNCLAVVYQRLARWDEAVAMLASLLKFPSGVDRPQVLMTLGAIFQARLHHPIRAQEYYTAMLQEFPTHPLSAVARAELKRLAASVP